MTYIALCILLLAAFTAARYYRSTKMWWIYLFTILLGLLIGVTSKVSYDNKSEDKVTWLYNTDNSLCCSIDMQSLVFAVTEGSTIVRPRLQVINNNIKLLGALYNMHLTKGRDQPSIKDSS